MNVQREELDEFWRLIDLYRYDFCKLVYIIFPFGQPGHDLENMAPYDWQMEEWEKMSRWFQNPETRDLVYRLIISSGNGAAKTAFGAMTVIMLLYTQRLHARITANTMPQMNSIVWPEYDIWFNRARYVSLFFEKFGTSIKARDAKYAEKWRLDTITWSEQSPSAISGLHNKGGAVAYIFEEAPGIPATIWNYSRGAFTETGTMKLHLAFGNSDDPESKFEQNMNSSLWHSRRIDTRELSHVSKQFVADILQECNGDEDHDEFRVRVRGMPRKTSKDSIISLTNVSAAVDRAKGFDPYSVMILPCTLMCDPAWTGGDETVIAMRQGNYIKILERYVLDKAMGETHNVTFLKLCEYERTLKADAVFIDQAEGTAIYTLAMNSGRTSWELVSFASSPTDNVDPKASEYANVRAQMYYAANDFFSKGGVLDFREKEWEQETIKQLCWAKGTRHKTTMKKLVESKLEIKARVGKSPDVADAVVLAFARVVMDRLPENDTVAGDDRFQTGQGSMTMPDHPDPYGEVHDVEYERLYD